MLIYRWKGGDKLAKLTPKQQLFVQEYLIDLNATQAAIRAGYSVQTAQEQGSRMLSNVMVQNAIAKAMAERSKRTQITADMVVKELSKIAFADIKDFLSFRTAQTVIGHDEEGDPVIDYSQIIDLKDSDDVDGRMIQEVSINSKGVFTFKLHDKMAALDKLGKHLGLYNDSLKVDINTPKTPYDELTVEELRALAGLCMQNDQ